MFDESDIREYCPSKATCSAETEMGRQMKIYADAAETNAARRPDRSEQAEREERPLEINELGIGMIDTLCPKHAVRELRA